MAGGSIFFLAYSVPPCSEGTPGPFKFGYGIYAEFCRSHTKHSLALHVYNPRRSLTTEYLQLVMNYITWRSSTTPVWDVQVQIGSDQRRSARVCFYLIHNLQVVSVCFYLIHNLQVVKRYSIDWADGSTDKAKLACIRIKYRQIRASLGWCRTRINMYSTYSNFCWFKLSSWTVCPVEPSNTAEVSVRTKSGVWQPSPDCTFIFFGTVICPLQDENYTSTTLQSTCILSSLSWSWFTPTPPDSKSPISYWHCFSRY